MMAAFAFMCMTCGLNLMKFVSPTCPCPNPESCQFQDGQASLRREVYVYSNGATNVEGWKWETFNTVVVPAFFSVTNNAQRDTMCVTHQHGRQFAITVPMDLAGPIKNSSSEAKAWVKAAVDKQTSWWADVVNVDLMPYFSRDEDSTDTDHTQLALIMKDLRRALNSAATTNIKMMCVVPWKPACSTDKKSTCRFTDLALDGCDFFTINPDSFHDDSNIDRCRAGPTIPFAKLISGISDYIAHHVTFSQLVIGIPWHGYDYKCSSFVNGVCKMEQTGDSGTVCNYKRERLSLATIYDKFRDHLDQPTNNPIYNAPYFNYRNHTDRHQVWYEEHMSLKSKYQLAIELNLKGIAIMYVDDLMSFMTIDLLQRENLMWSWLSHQVLLMKSQDHKNDLHVADTVAGVAVGCLLLGTLLGVIFTCLALRHRVKKPKHPPFMGDRDTMDALDEFTDEDPNL